MIKLHNFPRWWLPDMIEVVEEIPKTSLGNFKKKRAAREVRPEGSRRRLDREVPARQPSHGR